MLGVTHTYIKCFVKSCKYNDNNYCDPPSDAEGDSHLKIGMTYNRKITCLTYKSKRRKNK